MILDCFVGELALIGIEFFFSGLLLSIDWMAVYMLMAVVMVHSSLNSSLNSTQGRRKRSAPTDDMPVLIRISQ